WLTRVASAIKTARPRLTITRLLMRRGEETLGEENRMADEERSQTKEVVVVDEVEELGIVLFVEYRVTISSSARRRMEDVSSVGILATR
ncbi:hypothetical protein A2U01_0082519, partial [Trifolium medium]|nr:hypothetical protein [Trifolium medium]